MRYMRKVEGGRGLERMKGLEEGKEETAVVLREF
jgi:hypothetical protein